MLENIYRLDGKYPDPHEIESRLKQLSANPDSAQEYKAATAELREAGFSEHPLLNRFLVES